MRQECPYQVWVSVSAPLPCFLFLGVTWCQDDTGLPPPHPLGHEGRGFGPQCSHPSCPNVMFSLKRRLSSRSSWVMWHHFSLQAQVTGQGVQSAAASPATRPALL